MQKKQLDIVLIIGTGGVAFSFVSALKKRKSYKIYAEGSNDINTKEFCSKNKIKPFTDLENKKDLIILLAVPDAQIEVCSKKYSKYAKLMIHFSGTTSIESISKHSRNAAVCWPLESFNNNKKINLAKITCVIDSTNDFSSKIIIELIRNLNSQYVFMNNEDRMKLHLTAVMLNNFMYHFFTLVKQWTKNENIDSALLDGLFKSTISSFYIHDNGENQTGPAKRKDEEVVNQHLKLLNNYPELREIYSVFTQSIMRKQKN
jgi:predicted short-subunit dehydrogenase-like oxidoreductase (DUF2520 family)